MAINTIHDLDESKPIPAGLVSRLDTELKELKQAIKLTFPKIDVAIVADITKINAAPVELGKIEQSLTVLEGNINTLHAAIVKASSDHAKLTYVDLGAMAAIEKGIMFPFIGDVHNIPSGFVLANGLNDTPSITMVSGSSVTAFIMKE